MAMRIGIEAQRLFRKKKHGMEVAALELIEQLQKVDKENEYFVFVKDDEDASCLSETDNFKTVVVPGRSFPDWEQWQLPRHAEKYQLDLLHCTSNTAPLVTKIPLVVTIHDLIYMEGVSFAGSAYQNFGNLYRRFIVPKVAQKSAHIITVSEYERKNILDRLPLKPEKVSVAYNGVDRRFRLPARTEQEAGVLKRYGLPSEYFFFLGNTAPRKNLNNLLLAYAKLCETNPEGPSLAITGLGEAYLSKVLQPLQLGHLLPKIVLTGFIDKADLPLLYGMAMAYLYPSLREGFGMPIIEAMACGAPVLTSNTSSMPEVAGSAAVLVDPTQVESITAGMHRLLTNGELREQKVKAGVERAQKFTWEHTAQTVRAIYQEVSLRQKVGS